MFAALVAVAGLSVRPGPYITTRRAALATGLGAALATKNGLEPALADDAKPQFKRLSPIQFIAALGEPGASSGTGADQWRLVALSGLDPTISGRATLPTLLATITQSSHDRDPRSQDVKAPTVTLAVTRSVIDVTPTVTPLAGRQSSHRAQRRRQVCLPHSYSHPPEKRHGCL